MRKPQTCRRSYLLLAGSSGAYLLLAGSSIKLIFIGWLPLRTACKLCWAEVEVGGGALPGGLGPTLIALSPVWEKHTSLFPPSEQRQSSYCLYSPRLFIPPTSLSIRPPLFELISSSMLTDANVPSDANMQVRRPLFQTTVPHSTWKHELSLLQCF